LLAPLQYTRSIRRHTSAYASIRQCLVAGPVLLAPP
jgi:hypothetical protein